MSIANNASSPQREYQRLLKLWREYYRRPIYGLIDLCRSHDITDMKIAEAMGISKQGLNVQYPRMLYRRNSTKTGGEKNP